MENGAVSLLKAKNRFDNYEETQMGASILGHHSQWWTLHKLTFHGQIEGGDGLDAVVVVVTVAVVVGVVTSHQEPEKSIGWMVFQIRIPIG